MAKVEIRGLSRRFEGAEGASLDGLDLAVEDGELLGYLSYADRRVEQSDDAEVPGAESRGADACGSDDNGASGDERLLVRDLQHTVIDPEQRGRGLGSVLVPAVLDDIRARGAKLMPTCPFVRGWIDEHPDQQDLVA